jgi:hypothetical protein
VENDLGRNAGELHVIRRRIAFNITNCDRETVGAKRGASEEISTSALNGWDKNSRFSASDPIILYLYELNAFPRHITSN